MNENTQDFNQILAGLGKRLQTDIQFDEGGHCSFLVDGKVVVNMDYLEDSQAILLWSTLGRLSDDEHSLNRAKYLLRFQDLGLESNGFAIGFDSKDRRAVIHDMRSLAELTSEDKFSAWIETLVSDVEKIRQAMVDQFPYNPDSDELPEEPAS